MIGNSMDVCKDSHGTIDYSTDYNNEKLGTMSLPNERGQVK